MSETVAEPWEYMMYIPHDLRAVTVSRRTVRLIPHPARTHPPHRRRRAGRGRVGLQRRTAYEGAGGATGAVGAGVLRIGAWDADPQPPEPSLPWERVADAEEGRGLALVRACADLWGWQPLATNGQRGKYVWCELAAA